MRRVFVDSIDGGQAVLTGGEHKHLSVVLRAKKGDKFALVCGDGFVYGGVIEKIEREKTTVKIVDKTADTTEPNILCDLYLGMIKGEHLEIAVQKAVELGVNNIYPLLTQNAVKTGVNLERLNKIALEAAKQCGRGRLPKVLAPKTFDEAYKALKRYDLAVFPYEKADKLSIKEFLDAYAAAIKSSAFAVDSTKKIAVIIGSEGGFTAEEAAKMSEIATPVSLGARILRADTAAIVAIIAVMYAFDEMSVGGEKK